MQLQKAILLGHLRKRLHNEFSSNWSSQIPSQPIVRQILKRQSVNSVILPWWTFLPKMSTYLL